MQANSHISAFLFFVEQLVEINKSLKILVSRRKRNSSVFNIFVDEQFRQGKTLKEAVENWKKDREGLRKLAELGRAVYEEKS